MPEFGVQNKVIDSKANLDDHESHYGRDALVGVALFLSLLAERKIEVSTLRASYPSYFMSKKKIDLNPSIDVDAILEAMEAKYSHEDISASKRPWYVSMNFMAQK